MIDIFWLCWPTIYKNSWIWKYSLEYISGLSDRYKIKDIWIDCPPSSLLRLFYQFLIIPLYFTFFHRKKIKVFYDEGWLLVFLIYFIPNSYIIIHDIREEPLKIANIKHKLYGKLVGLSYKKLVKMQKIISVSEFTKQKILNLWLSNLNVEVIPNVVNLSKKFTTNLEKLECRKYFFQKADIKTHNLKKKMLLYVWSQEPRKNVILILQSLRLLWKDFTLLIIGNPVDKITYKKNLKYIADYSLDVLQIQNISDNDLFYAYKSADVLLAPSLFEWFWRTPVEAQSLGCPVISTHMWALKEVLKDSAYILKNPKDPWELAEQINIIIADTKIRESFIQKWFENSQRYDLAVNIEKWSF